MTDEKKMHRQLAVMVAETVSAAESTALTNWIDGLLQIRAQQTSSIVKAKRAIQLTRASQVVWPVVKVIARRTRQAIWDNRSTSAKLGLSGSALGIVLFGGQNAGIAALGTAIGVPLWVVFGAGAAFANVLREELLRKKTDP